jgi:RNA polymerase sigma factor (sigma-70 family)
MSISADILKGCRENNRHCQRQLYDHYYSFMMSICYRYVNEINDARFLVNEGFFKILTRIEKYDPAIPFEIWMRRVMINTLIDHHRKTAKEKKQVVLQENPGAYTAMAPFEVSRAEAQVATEELEKMLQKVPEVSRRVFNLFAIDGYSHKEIAALLHITEGTSKWHVSSARQILKQQLSVRVKKTEFQSYAK